MSSTQCGQRGQVEIGTIQHEGREFFALGASVVGRHITAYAGRDRRGFYLTRWAGATMLACRSVVVERFWNGGLALMFVLPRNRFIIGYALGENGDLFRGELVDGCTHDDARRQAVYVSEFFGELDAEEEAEMGEG